NCQITGPISVRADDLDLDRHVTIEQSRAPVPMAREVLRNERSRQPEKDCERDHIMAPCSEHRAKVRALSTHCRDTSGHFSPDTFSDSRWHAHSCALAHRQKTAWRETFSGVFYIDTEAVTLQGVCDEDVRSPLGSTRIR